MNIKNKLKSSLKKKILKKYIKREQDQEEYLVLKNISKENLLPLTASECATVKKLWGGDKYTF